MILDADQKQRVTSVEVMNPLSTTHKHILSLSSPSPHFCTQSNNNTLRVGLLSVILCVCLCLALGCLGWGISTPGVPMCYQLPTVTAAATSNTPDVCVCGGGGTYSLWWIKCKLSVIHSWWSLKRGQTLFVHSVSMTDSPVIQLPACSAPLCEGHI